VSENNLAQAQAQAQVTSIKIDNFFQQKSCCIRINDGSLRFS
jgi:hypothetical protein